MTLKPNHRIGPEKQSVKPSTSKEKGEGTQQELLDVSPCYLCEEIRICGEGQMISPLNCPKMNKWLQKRKGD